MILFMIFIPVFPAFIINQDKKNIKGFDFKENCENYFCVFDESIGKIVNIPEREFIYGTVATEMPVSFEIEALKAQTVAAYTYFSRIREEFRRKNGQGQGEITINSKNWKYYVSVDQMKEKWGENFLERYDKIKSAVDSVFGETLEYEGSLILSVYHAMSSGQTEKSKDVFGGEFSYLTSVSSPGDKEAKDYETSAEFSVEELKQILESAWSDCKFDENPNFWIRDIERTESGMVKSIVVCSHKTNGRELRSLFSLRSADFDVEYQNDKFVFKVRGYGHGVGMSQYGAQFMAKQGADYKKILKWYYPGTVLTNKT